MLPCVTVPDLAGFDWPAARRPGFERYELRLRRCDGGPPLEPRTNWEDRAFGATTPPDAFVQVQPARFDRPTGGTEEFLGSMPKYSACSASGVLSASSRCAARRGDPTPHMCLVP